MNNIKWLILVIICVEIVSCSRHMISMDEFTLSYGDNKITVFESTFEDVQGLDIGIPEKTEWGDFSFEYYYPKIGVSFSYKKSDPNKTIGWISVYPKKARGEIKGIIQIKKGLRVEDIVNAFGEGEWTYTDDLSELDLDYEYFTVEVFLDEEFLNDNLETTSDPNWEYYYDFYKKRKVNSIVFY